MLNEAMKAEVTQADRIADAVAAIISEQVATEFKGFWAPEDLLEELPGMIRVAVCDILARHRQQAERDVIARMEVVGWMYTSAFGREVCKRRWASDEGMTSDHWIGWTETPLYALPTPPEAA